MFDPEFEDEGKTYQQFVDHEQLPNNTKYLDSINSQFHLQSLESTSWSSSGRTVSPTPASSRDLYSPSMFGQEHGLDTSFHEAPPEGSHTAEDQRHGANMSPASTWPTIEADPILFDFSGNDDWNSTEGTRTARQDTAAKYANREAIAHHGSSSKHSTSKTHSQPKSLRPTTTKKPPAPLAASRRKKYARSNKSTKYRFPTPSSLSDDQSPSSSSDPKARTNHNLIERKYRNRLNEQFNCLLSALPSHTGKYQAKHDEAKRVSKAEVLILAQKRINQLEREKQELECQRCKLQNSLESLKAQFATRVSFPT